MAILTKGTDFSSGDQVTPTNLDALVDSATFDDPADETSIEKNTGTGKLQVKDAGITTAKIADDGVTSDKIATGAVIADGIGAGAVVAAGIGALAVTEAKIGANAVSEAKIKTTMISGHAETTAAPADDDELLISDTSAGANKRIDVSDLAKCRFFPQAYGVVDLDGAATLTGAYNVQNPTDGTGSVTLEFINDMSDANYVVIASYADTTGTNSATITISARAVGEFTISTNSGDGSGKAIHFAVFGTPA